MPFKYKNGRGYINYRKRKCIIGIDQSYKRTGISIAVDGKLKVVKGINFKNVKDKTRKRYLLRDTLRKAIEKCLQKFESDEIAVICERIRTYTGSDSLRPQVIKAHAALVAIIIDTAYEYGIETYSVDTRCWKTTVLGTSKPIFEPIEGVKDPQKFGSVRKVIDLGFEKSIYIKAMRKGKFSYDDDAADSACIALYQFMAEHIKLERET